jgi:glycosyltransferase involved in cell wall biosynthesis
MSCGTPVIASAVTSIPEIVDDAAILIDPNNLSELQTSIVKVINDSDLYDSLIRKGLKKAKEFSWERTARETLAAYQNTCSQ